MKTQPRVNVVQQPDNPIEKNIVAAAIISISEGMAALQKSGLTFEAIVVLTQHNCRRVGKGYKATKPTIPEIRAVFESLCDLKRTYITGK